MTKSKIVEMSELLISNINKLRDSSDIHEVFYLYDVIREQLDEIHIAKVDYLGDI